MFIKIKNNLCVYLGVALCLFLGIFFVFFKKQASPKEHLHRVEKQLRLAQNNNNSLAKRREALDRAAVYAHFLAPSAIKQEKLNGIAYQAYYLKDSIQFRRLNHSALAEAKLTADTMAIADVHWNFGAFYLSHENYAQAFYHYAEAQKGFAERHAYYEAKMWYNMAFIKGRLKDYPSSEAYIYKALPYFLEANKHKQLYRCYTQLGLIYEELEGIDQAYHFHHLALQALPKKPKGFLQEACYNNIGLLWHKQGAYQKAIGYYNRALANTQIKTKRPALYARLLDNRAYSKLGAHIATGVEKDFFKALHLRDSLGNTAGMSINQLHIAEWYMLKNDTLTAIKYANEAYKAAQRIQLKRECLAALKFLAKIDIASADHYLDRWQAIQKELQQNLRRQRHHVAKIEFKTEQYQKETLQLSRQKKILIGILVAMGCMGVLIYVFARQRRKYKKLKQLQYQEQQLQQEREEERYRIAEELHDGVLSKLFGIRLQWGLLSLKGAPEEEKEHRFFLQGLQKLEHEIREISHDLKTGPGGKSLPEALQHLVYEKSKIGNFNYDLKASALEKNDVSEEIKHQVYAMLEEALQNIVKHARAEKVHIRFDCKKSDLYLIIQDNGKGFRVRAKIEGIGLKNMENRTRKIGGKMWIKSSPGKGTYLFIKIPM